MLATGDRNLPYRDRNPRPPRFTTPAGAEMRVGGSPRPALRDVPRVRAQTWPDKREFSVVNAVLPRQQKLRIDKVESTAVPPNTERTLFDKTGPGAVVSLWMALGGGAAPALDARLRVYYDGSPNASIDIDMGTLLATHWGAGSTDTSHSVSTFTSRSQRELPPRVPAALPDTVRHDIRRLFTSTPGDRAIYRGTTASPYDEVRPTTALQSLPLRRPKPPSPSSTTTSRRSRARGRSSTPSVGVRAPTFPVRTNSPTVEGAYPAIVATGTRLVEGLVLPGPTRSTPASPYVAPTNRPQREHGGWPRPLVRNGWRAFNTSLSSGPYPSRLHQRHLFWCIPTTSSGRPFPRHTSSPTEPLEHTLKRPPSRWQEDRSLVSNCARRVFSTPRTTAVVVAPAPLPTWCSPGPATTGAPGKRCARHDEHPGRAMNGA